MSYNLITILGPTAVGKTFLAANLAYKFKGEIISADSRQVYRGMDIGTGKDLKDYVVNNTTVPYHLIDIMDPSEEFNLYLFQNLFYSVFEKIRQNHKLPFLAGGTALYTQSILKNYELVPAGEFKKRKHELSSISHTELVEILNELNSDMHNTTDILDKERTIQAIIIAEAQKTSDQPVRRTDIHPFILGVKEDRDKIKENITKRLKDRLQNGMIEEVENLVKKGITYEKLYFFGLEYRFIGQYLSGELNYNDMYQKLNSAIHNFAKHQMTWFRKMERSGININWLNGPDLETATKLLNEIELEF